MGQRLLHVVYAIEFLVALVAALAVWREVGGQVHLDLMPWYVKSFFAGGLALAIVKVTVASADQHKRRTFLWSLAVLLLLVGSGLVTYYYHLNEPLDDEEDSAPLTAHRLDSLPGQGEESLFLSRTYRTGQTAESSRQKT